MAYDPFYDETYYPSQDEEIQEPFQVEQPYQEQQEQPVPEPFREPVTFTQAERNRLQRLQQGLSVVQEQADDGTLTPEESGLLSQQIERALGPLRQRQGQAEYQGMMAQNSRLKHMMAQQEALQQENSKFRAHGLESRVSVLTNPTTGEEMHMFEESPNHWAPVPWPSLTAKRDTPPRWEEEEKKTIQAAPEEMQPFDDEIYPLEETQHAMEWPATRRPGPPEVPEQPEPGEFPANPAQGVPHEAFATNPDAIRAAEADPRNFNSQGDFSNDFFRNGGLANPDGTISRAPDHDNPNPWGPLGASNLSVVARPIGYGVWSLRDRQHERTMYIPHPTESQINLEIQRRARALISMMDRTSPSVEASILNHAESNVRSEIRSGIFMGMPIEMPIEMPRENVEIQEDVDEYGFPRIREREERIIRNDIDNDIRKDIRNAMGETPEWMRRRMHYAGPQGPQVPMTRDQAIEAEKQERYLQLRQQIASQHISPPSRAEVETEIRNRMTEALRMLGGNPTTAQRRTIWTRISTEVQNEINRGRFRGRRIAGRQTVTSPATPARATQEQSTSDQQEAYRQLIQQLSLPRPGLRRQPSPQAPIDPREQQMEIELRRQLGIP